MTNNFEFENNECNFQPILNGIGGMTPFSPAGPPKCDN